MKRIPLFAFVLLCLLSFSACNPSAQQAMKFQVNPALLGKIEQDTMLQIAYAAPTSFTRFSDEATIKQRQKEMQQEEGVDILTVYQDESTQAFMIVSTMTRNRWDELHEQVRQPEPDMPSRVWSTVSATAFEYNTFSVLQWLLQNQTWVDFKLMYKSKDNRYFQVDYLIPNAAYDENFARAIESSIGSFKSL